MVPKPNNILEIPNHLQIQIVTLTGYTYRFMFLAVSHEGKTNANGAGDETFRFWNVFPSMKAQKKALRSVENINPGLFGIYIYQYD